MTGAVGCPGGHGGVAENFLEMVFDVAYCSAAGMFYKVAPIISTWWLAGA